tara:strand:+ start:225 stop:416 length:192 start_codon:yes stop_codon:yes gene_type:complete
MLKKLLFFFLLLSFSFSQLEVGDESPDFEAPICNNNVEGADDTWSLYDEGAGKVIWLDLYTSW